MSTHSHASVMAQMIAAAFPDIVMDVEKNVITFGYDSGPAFLVTVESLYEAPDSDPMATIAALSMTEKPLPDPNWLTFLAKKFMP